MARGNRRRSTDQRQRPRRLRLGRQRHRRRRPGRSRPRGIQNRGAPGDPASRGRPEQHVLPADLGPTRRRLRRRRQRARHAAGGVRSGPPRRRGQRPGRRAGSLGVSPGHGAPLGGRNPATLARSAWRRYGRRRGAPPPPNAAGAPRPRTSGPARRAARRCAAAARSGSAANKVWADTTRAMRAIGVSPPTSAPRDSRRCCGPTRTVAIAACATG